MRVKSLLGLAPGLLEIKLFPELFGLPSHASMGHETYLSQESVQVLFADLQRTKRSIPLASLTTTCHCLHILHDSISEWHNRQEVCYDAGFGFPPATSRWWYPLLSVEPIVKALLPSPFAVPSRSSHGSSRLNGILDVIECFCHEIEHRVFCPNYAIAFKLASRIDSYHKLLIVWFLFVTELDVEQP